MRIGRRRFLGCAGAALGGAGAGWAGAGWAGADPVTVEAAPAEVQLLPRDYAPTGVWAYDGTVPGPGLRVPQGARIGRRFVNGLPQASTIHWHGIRIANAMDGVPGLTQTAVAPGEAFDYDFTVPDAGTYWYHPHRNSVEQLSRGLSAPLIVDEAEPPDVDADLVLVLNDWRLGRDAQIVADFDNMHDRSHAGRIGNVLTVNGAIEAQHAARRHDRLRLRLINAATGRVVTLGALGLSGWVVALDGMPLAVPEPFERLVLAPAQRADLIVDVTAPDADTAFLTSIERDGGYALAAFPVAAGPAAPRAVPAALPPNPVTEPAPAGARRVPLRMEGGAMGGMAAAQVPGRGEMTIRELVANGLAWSLNGVAGMPEAPLVEAAWGETVRLALINDTAFAHAMHLHGHHFRELRAEGVGPLRDTVLVPPRESREVAFAADNPGDWMLHCHMVAHMAAGMATWLRVG